MKVYINASADELPEFREAVLELINNAGYEAVTAPDGEDEASRHELLRRVQEADVFVGIYAHRYGHMIRGEATSLPEQAFRRAVSKGKDILVYTAGPDGPWPEGLMEDDFIKRERLNQFRSELSAKWAAVPFHDPGDIVANLAPRLHELSQIYDRMAILTRWAEGINSRRKLHLISILAEANSTGHLSDDNFRIAAQLIARNFEAAGPEVTPKQVDLTEALMKKDIGVDAYVEEIGGSALQRWVPPRGPAPMVLIACACVILGYSVSRVFSPEAGHGQSSQSYAADTSYVLVADSAAPTLTEDPVAVEPSPRAVESDFPENREHETVQEESTPPPGTEQALSRDAGDIKKPPDERIDRLLAMATSDTVEVSDLLSRWKDLLGVFAAGSEEQAFTATQVAMIESRLESRARIALEENMVICEDVDRETRMPRGIRTHFSPGELWMWARIHTSRTDTIRAEWFTEGRLYYSRSAAVPGPSFGYRVYFSHSHPPARIGKNEVRLFNGAGDLVGRRVYYIDPEGGQARGG